MIDWLTLETGQLLLKGFALTLLLTVMTSVLSLVMGLGIGMLRMSPRSGWSWLARAYINIYRNVPALVLIIFWAFAVPNIFPLTLRQSIFFDNQLFNLLNRLIGLSVSYYAVAATLALSLNSSAYVAELFRAGVGTVAQEHLDTARSLGASPHRIFWQILLPQGMQAAFPAISTRLIHTMKNTALAAFIAVPEFFQGTQTAITRTFRAVEFLLLAAVVYLLIAWAYASLLHWIEYMLKRRRLSRILRTP